LKKAENYNSQPSSGSIIYDCTYELNVSLYLMVKEGIGLIGAGEAEKDLFAA